MYMYTYIHTYIRERMHAFSRALLSAAVDALPLVPPHATQRSTNTFLIGYRSGCQWILDSGEREGVRLWKGVCERDAGGGVSVRISVDIGKHVKLDIASDIRTSLSPYGIA